MNKVVVWIFSHQDEYRGLLAGHPNLGILGWEDLKINLLRPPAGVDPLRYVNISVQNFSKDWHLYQPSENFLRESILALMDAYGVFDTEANDPDEIVYPSLPDLRDFLTDIRGKMAGIGRDYHTAVLNRVQGICDSMGCLVDCERGYLDALLDQSTIFEFGGLPASQEQVLVGAMASHVFQVRQRTIAQEGPDALPHMLLVMDEVQNLIAKSNEGLEGLGRGTVEEILAKCRKLKMSVMVIDQRPSAVANYVLALCVNKIVGRLEDWHDIRAIASGLGLSREQCVELGEFEPGTAIVKTADHAPVVKVKFRPFDGPKTVDPSVVDERRGRLLKTLHYRERIPWEKIKRERERQTTGVPSREIPPKVWAYVLDVIAGVLIPATDRAARMGIGASTEHRLKYLAMEHELIRCFRFDQDKGSPVLLCEPTPKALTLAKVDLSALAGQGGPLHRAFQREVSRLHGRRGELGEIEQTVNGKRVDVGLQVDGGKVAIEIAMYGDWQVKNIAEDAAAGFPTVRLLVRTRKILNNIMETAKRTLPESVLSRVEPHLVWSYLQELESDSVGNIPRNQKLTIRKEES